MCGILCLILKCILKLIFMHFYTCNVMGTEMSSIRCNGFHIKFNSKALEMNMFLESLEHRFVNHIKKFNSWLR